MTDQVTDARPPSATWQPTVRLARQNLAGLIELHREIWSTVDPQLADLARRRLAQLLGSAERAAMVAGAASGEVPPTSSEIQRWPRSPQFGPAERAVLAFVEQFVIDVSAVDQALVDGLLAVMTPGECYALVSAIWLFEAVLRAELVLGESWPAAELGLVEVAA